jgi:hypothetical protein
MNRCLTLAAGLALSLTSLAKALPPIMDHVPAGAPIVIVIPSIEKLEKDVNSVMQLAGAPPVVQADQMLAQAGLSGISKKGSLAMVILKTPDPDGDEPPMVAICQTDDYAGLTKGLNAAKDGELDKAVIDGKDVWMKSIGGGYVVAGSDKDNVAKFDGKSAGDAHKKFYGARADKMSDKADVAVFLDIAKLKPLIEEGISQMEQQIADMQAMTGQDGNGEQIKWFKDHVIGDMTSGVAALSIDAQGVSFDLTGVAKEGSGLAKAFETAGKAHALLGKLPAGPYLAAYAADFSSKGWKDFFKSMPTPGADKKGGGGGIAGLGSVMGSDPKLMEEATGMAMVVGVPPGGIMSGVLTRTTGYLQTPNPEKVIAFYRDELPKVMEKEQVGKLEYKAGVTEIEGRKVDAFDMTISPDEGIPGMGQIMQGMFGMSGGPSAYITAVDGGVVTTMSKSSEMMTAAIKASKGENTLASDKILSAVAEKLPTGRSVEMYIGAKGLLDTLLPMAAMFGGKPIKIEIPEKLPPLAGGVAMGDGQVHATFYIPADIIKTGGEIARAFNAPEPEEDAGKGEKKDGDAAPKDDKKANPKF